MHDIMPFLLVKWPTKAEHMACNDHHYNFVVRVILELWLRNEIELSYSAIVGYFIILTSTLSLSLCIRG